MAIWPHFLSSRFHINWMKAFFLFNLAAALAELNSSSIVYAVIHTRGHVQGLYFRNLQPSFLLFILNYILALARDRFLRLLNGQLEVWDMVQLITACSLVEAFRVWTRKRKAARPQRSTYSNEPALDGSNRHDSVTALPRVDSESSKTDAETTDPGLLRKYSSFKSYDTPIGTYPSIRTFYRPHSQATKLPSKPTPLPLLVFIHGLGGSLAQFHPLLTSLVNVAPCLGVDLPGCGLSEFSPKTWEHYTFSSLVELLSTVIAEHCNQQQQEVILVGHSMGCSLSALLASATSPLRAKNGIHILALIAICPQASPPSDEQISTYKKLLRVPTPIFNLWRRWDRRGGPESASVARFVGAGADIETKRLQERFNAQSRTAVWRRMAWGVLPKLGVDNTLRGGLPGLDTWAKLTIPLFLIAGEADGITKPGEIGKIGKALGRTEKPSLDISTGDAIDALTSVRHRERSDGKLDRPGRTEKLEAGGISNTEITYMADKAGPNIDNENGNGSYSRKRQVLKTSILPAPASHALLYDPATYRTLAGLIQTFLYNHVDTRLSLGWQLQHLSTEGKWDVKNLKKWQAVRPVSEPIAGVFRALKTLREIDETHSPEKFVLAWKGKIRFVIDISHESPVYDPKGLEKGGIEYHKFPTVSKIPPTPDEVKDFIRLVDHLRSNPSPDVESALIGVHCHYGFNRTGFFLCSYLIEKERFGVQQAIDEFRTRRPPGIRHEHFLDTLFVRYCVGLKRTPTI